MSRRDEYVQERLQLFFQVAAETRSYEDAMWAVLQADRRRYSREVKTAIDARAEEVITAVSVMTGVGTDLLVGRQRTPLVVEARWVAMRALRDEGYSLPAIGRCLKKHHASVLYALSEVARRPDLIAKAQDARSTGLGLAA